MADDLKKMIPIGVILFTLVLLAWYSLSTLPRDRKISPAPSLPSPDQVAAVPATKDSISLPMDSRPVAYLPTNEEIQLRIEDQNQKREAREKLRAARDKKADAVIAAVNAAPAPTDSQEAISEDVTPHLTPEKRAERNKELQDGIKAHMYFPR